MSYLGVTNSIWSSLLLDSQRLALKIATSLSPSCKIVCYSLFILSFTACCHHMNNTFITLDKVVYNYTLTRACEQILLRNCYKNMTRMMVLTRRLGIDKYPLRRIVTTLVDKYEIVFVPRKDMKQLPIITVRLVFHLPYISLL